MALTIKKIEKNVGSELNELNKSAAEFQLAKGKIERSMNDLNDLKNYFNEMMQINAVLEHLFKTVRTSFNKVENSALTNKQSNGYRSRTQQVIKQIIELEKKADSLTKTKKNEQKKMKGVEHDLYRNVRKLRRIVRNLRRHAKHTSKRGKEIREIAEEIGFKKFN